jgi:hypothetical protein
MNNEKRKVIPTTQVGDPPITKSPANYGRAFGIWD